MKTKVVRKSFQQGDLIGRKLSEMPSGVQVHIACKRLVLAHGESGHSHVIEDDEAELIRIGERMLLSLTKQAIVTHEEHKAITIAPGIWEIGRVKEYDYITKMERQVVD